MQFGDVDILGTDTGELVGTIGGTHGAVGW
jgi:hypothetical protein